MKVKFNVQKECVNTLKEKFLLHSNSELKKTYMLIGNMKDTGFDILEEFLIDLKARKYFVIGIDKKNTTRRMLEELCRYTKNVYVYNNNGEFELDASVYVFEYAKEGVIYITSGSLSMSSFETDFSCYTEVVFDFSNEQDKLEYKEFVDKIVKVSKEEEFVQIDKAYVEKLVNEKAIFSTKQYTHNVPSISDLMGNNMEKVQNVVEDYDQPSGLPKVELKTIDFPFEIDLGEKAKISETKENNDDSILFEEFKKKNTPQEYIDESIKEIPEEEEKLEIADDVIDMEEMLFERADIELVRDTKKKNDNSDETKSRKVDLEKVSNLFLELPAKSLKDSDKLKVPNYVKELIENFFEGLNKEKFVTSSSGSVQRKQSIKVEIIDVNNGVKYKDNASIVESRGKTYICFNIDKLSDITYDEKDIARVIKLSSDTYHIEIIPKTSEEYLIWKKLCTTSMRGTDRCYGVM